MGGCVGAQSHIGWFTLPAQYMLDERNLSGKYKTVVFLVVF
jgi:hypothetical protein